MCEDDDDELLLEEVVLVGFCEDDEEFLLLEDGVHDETNMTKDNMTILDTRIS